MDLLGVESSVGNGKKELMSESHLNAKQDSKEELGISFFLCVCVIDGRLLNLFLESNTTFVSLKEF